MKDVAGRLAAVNLEIESACRSSGRRRDAVRLIAVSKFHPDADIQAAIRAGQMDFGENYVQEALAKQAVISAGESAPRWHMIGHVQSRKARDVAGKFEMIHTLDSIKLANALQKHIDGNVQKVLIEVNASGEKQKSGIRPEDAQELARHVLERCPGLDLRGLMCMAPVYDAGELARPHFARLRRLRDALEHDLGVRLPELSMGMSGDFGAAIAEGATMVRIGTAIFGARPLKRPE